MIFPTAAVADNPAPVSPIQIPRRRKKSRTMAMAGGLVILDWLFLVACGLGLGIALVVFSIASAMI